MLVILVIYCDIMMLNLIKVKFLGGEARKFGGEASPLSPPLDETLMLIKSPTVNGWVYRGFDRKADPWGGLMLVKSPTHPLSWIGGLQGI